MRDGVAEVLLRFAHGDSHRDCQAALPGASEGAVRDDLRSHIHVRVGEDDDGVLRASLTLSPLPLLSSTRIDVARNGVEPTKLMAFTSGWSMSVSTTDFPPFTMFATPGGRPHFSSSSNASFMVSGTRSDGLTMSVFPQAMA